MTEIYELYCETEQTWVKTDWAASEPTTCPNNAAHTVTSGSTHIVKTRKFKEVKIAKSGEDADYSTISEALAAETATEIVFTIGPGTYVENNPLVLRNGVVLRSYGNPENTIITAQNPNSDLIVLGTKCSIRGLTLSGATGPGARGVYLDGTQSGGYGKFSMVGECMIKNCDIGMESDGKNIPAGAPDSLLAIFCLVQTTSGVRAKGVYVHSKGQFISLSSQIIGVPSPSVPITNAIECTGSGSKVSMTTSSAWYCTNAIVLDDGAEGEFQLITIKYCNKAIVIGPTGTTTRISGDSIYMKNSITYDMDIQADNAILEMNSGLLHENLVNNPNAVKLNAKYHSVQYGKPYQGFIGDCHFGSVNEPAKIFMGEGRYDENNIIVLRNDNLEAGSWVNVSNEASSIEEPAFDLFSGVQAGNCVYIGRDTVVQGFKIHVTAAVPTANNSLVWEYWNGLDWVVFKVMQNSAECPYYTSDGSFISAVDKYHIRFGVTTQTPAVAKNLNGFTKKWMRLRIVSDISGVPVVESIKLHTNCTEINKDGYIEYFGNARVVCQLPFNFHSFCGTSVPTGNQDIFISDSLNLKVTNNKFSDSQITRIGFSAFLPNNADISFPLKLKLAFIGDSNTAGTIDWILKYSCTTAESAIYHNADDAPTDPAECGTVLKTTSLSSNSCNKDCRETIEIPIHGLIINPSSGNEHIIWVTLERDAITDTYPGSVSLVQTKLIYVTWNSGTHLLSF